MIALVFRSLIARLRSSQIAHWAAAYLAGAWLLLQILDLIAQPFAWPDLVMRAATAVLGVGFFAVLVLAWYHGERGAQRVTPVELLMLAGILVVAAAAVAFVGTGPRALRPQPEGSVLLDGRNGIAGPDAPPLLALRDAAKVIVSLAIEERPTWSPDGRALAFQSDRSGNWDIWVVQLGSGQAVNRTSDSPGEDVSPAWSPDGESISFFSSRNGGGYFIMPATGGVPRQVAPGNDAGTFSAPAAWSPAGAELVFARGQGAEPWLEIVTVATGASRRLSLPTRPRGNYIADADWSPDGGWIAYRRSISAVSATSELWLTPSSGGESIQLTEGTHRDRSPTWSPDSRELHFVSDRTGTPDLWALTIGSDGKSVGPPRQLTSGIEMEDAALSADGSKLAYTRGRRVRNIFRAPILDDRAAAWPDVAQLTFEEVDFESVDVSSDGRLLVSSDRSGNWDIFVLPAQGGDLQPVTTSPALDAGPRWSPDATQMVFYSSRSGHRQVWIQPLAGGAARQLTHGESNKLYPVWSPDARHVAVASEHGITVIDVQSGTDRLLTEQPSDAHPEWSPDGRWVAFSSARGGTPAVWRVPAAGGAPEPLTNRPSSRARWSPDGSRLFFLAQSDSDTASLYSPTEIRALSLDSRQDRRILDVAGRPGRLGTVTFAADDRFVYFTWEESRSDIWVAGFVPARER